MFKTIPAALLTLSLAASPLLAQTDETDSDGQAPAIEAETVTDPAPTTEAAPETEPQEDTTTDAAAEPQDTPADVEQPAAATDSAELRPGQPYVREEFGDWALRCLKAEAGQPDPCQLYQLLMDDEGNAVAEFSTFPLPPGNEAAAGATIVVPLETLLTANLRLSIDNGEPKVYPFTFCNPAGCVARVGFTEGEVAQLKRGAAATLVMVPAAAPDQTVSLNVSLTGFTAGFDSVNEQ